MPKNRIQVLGKSTHYMQFLTLIAAVCLVDHAQKKGATLDSDNEKTKVNRLGKKRGASKGL